MAQDRCASGPAAVWESMGIEFAPASYRSEAVRQEPGLLSRWLALTIRLGDDGGQPGATDQSGSGPHDATFGARGLADESDHHGDPCSASGTPVLGASYMGLHRARNSFGTADDTFAFGFDNTDTGAGSLDCGLQSSFVLAVGLDGQTRDGNVAVHAAAHLGIYAQLGVEPTFSLARLGGGDVTFALPLTMGFCLKNYYVDVDGRGDLLGYLDLGAVASSPLPFLPSRAGSWHVDVGLHWLLFGDSNEQRDAGESSELIVSIGLGTTF
jgi:hypothetical protein